MRKAVIRAAFSALLLSLALWAAGAAGEGVTRCLLIGCDRFVLMPWMEPASANNTGTMEALVRDFLPGKVAVTRSVNGPGTVEGFESLVSDTFADAGEEDTALIYLSTHGIFRQEEGSQYVALLLSDGKDEERLEPEKLREILDRIPGEKVLILDTCHSGAMIGMGGEGGVNWFRDGRYRVLVSSGATEKSWYWNAEENGFTGTGFFTDALNCALRASDPVQIDPEEKGSVSLTDLTARLRAIHGASTVYCWPEESREPLFILPEDRKAGDLLRGVTIGSEETDGDAIVVPIRFRAEEPVRLVYQLAPSRNGRWDFEHAVRLPDREKTGLTRGLLSPGEKDRKIRLSAKSLGEEGKALMQIFSLRGEERTPTAEAGWVITISPETGNLPQVQEKPEAE